MGGDWGRGHEGLVDGLSGTLRLQSLGGDKVTKLQRLDRQQNLNGKHMNLTEVDLGEADILK